MYQKNACIFCAISLNLLLTMEYGNVQNMFIIKRIVLFIAIVEILLPA